MAGYVLHYGTASGSYTAQVDVGNATGFSLTGLIGGTDYYIALKAYDTNGNYSAFSQEFLLQAPADTTPPALTAPVDLTVEASGALTSVDIGTATATDPSTPITISNDAPSAFSPGATTVTWTATDAKGNSSSATQIVTVVDTTAPGLTAPGDITAEATGTLTAVSIGMATATDLVGPVSITHDAPAGFPLGTTTVTWTATDAYGNQATAVQTVVVSDTTPPIPPNGVSGQWAAL
ncbi:MAG: HYR domain-containing protein [Leptospirillia bacterium]